MAQVKIFGSWPGATVVVSLVMLEPVIVNAAGVAYLRFNKKIVN